MEVPIVSDQRQHRRDPRLEDADASVSVCPGDGEPNPILEDVRDMGRIGARLDEKQARMLDLGQLDPKVLVGWPSNQRHIHRRNVRPVGFHTVSSR